LNISPLKLNLNTNVNSSKSNDLYNKVRLRAVVYHAVRRKETLNEQLLTFPLTVDMVYVRTIESDSKEKRSSKSHY
jgi:hypothetical protein